MDKFLFQNEEPKKRKELLSSQADGVSEEKYYRRLTSEEILQAKSEFTQNSLAMDDLEEQKKSMVDEFKENLKPLKLRRQELSSEVRTGIRQMQGTLYKVVDDETRMAYFYDEKGELIETMTRPALADELQRTIHMELRKNGTNE
jgi:hypothetical protein